MPDFAAHFLFGEQLAPPRSAQRWPALFNLGLQGPDIFFFRKAVSGASPYHEIASRLHKESCGRFLESMSAYCRRLSGQQQELAEAYMFGFAGHYCLDSVAHPYVYYWQRQMEAKKPGLTASTLHSQIESDIDADIYASTYGVSVCKLNITANYRLSPLEESALGALYTHLLYEVYQLLVAPGEIIAAARDMLAAQKLLFSGSRLIAGAAAALDKIHGNGQVFSAHIKGRQPKWDSLNLDKTDWKNSWTGETSDESFPELTERAARKYSRLVSVLERNAGGAMLPVEVDCDFSGNPLAVAAGSPV